MVSTAQRLIVGDLDVRTGRSRLQQSLHWHGFNPYSLWRCVGLFHYGMMDRVDYSSKIFRMSEYVREYWICHKDKYICVQKAGIN